MGEPLYYTGDLARRCNSRGLGSEEREMSRVCVTGASGYIATCLVKKLLERGYVVHGTLRNLDGAAEEAARRGGAAGAVRGGHVRRRHLRAGHRRLRVRLPRRHPNPSRPQQHQVQEQHGSGRGRHAHHPAAMRASQDGAARHPTASVTAASPLREDGGGGGGYKDFINESCWSPLNLTYDFTDAHLDGYVSSKSLSELELLSYNSSSSPAFEVVTLTCALIGGETLQPYLGSSIPVIVSPLTGDELHHNVLKFMQALLGSVPLAHIDDVCDAHVFCMDQPSIAGRFLCAAGYPTMKDYVDHFAAKFPEIEIKLKEVIGGRVRVQADTNKLVDLGFKYRYEVEETLDSSVECAKRLREL